MSHSTLSARLSVRQFDAVHRADAAADEVDGEIVKLWDILISIVQRSDLNTIRDNVRIFFQRLPDLAIKETGDALRRSVAWGHDTISRIYSQHVPRDALAVSAVQEAESDAPGVVALGVAARGIKARDNAGRLREPVRQRLPKEREFEIFRKLLFPPPSEERARQIVFEPFEGQTFSDRLLKLSNLGDPTAIADSIASGFAAGKTQQQIAKDLLPLVNNVKSAARRVARTESMRMIQRVSRDAEKQMGDVVAGYQIMAVLDQNTRDKHRFRHGRIWRKTSRKTMQEALLMDAGELPDGPNCRCYLSPIIAPIKDRKVDVSVFKNAKKQLIPNPAVYSDWWKQVDEARRRKAVGSKRFQKMLEILDRAPEWEEFIDPSDGSLMTIRQLEDETPVERARRVAKVKRQIKKRRQDIERQSQLLQLA